LKGWITVKADRQSWKKVLPLSEQKVALGFEYHYSSQEFSEICKGFIPKQMEDKWFIFYEEP
jgi:hypothetical protein